MRTWLHGGGIRLAVGLAGLAWGGTARACATCFGASDSKLAQGMNLGILALLAVVAVVLCGIAGFAVTLAVRSARVPPKSDPGPAAKPAEDAARRS
jgi:hypothetical protein